MNFYVKIVKLGNVIKKTIGIEQGRTIRNSVQPGSRGGGRRSNFTTKNTKNTKNTKKSLKLCVLCELKREVFRGLTHPGSPTLCVITNYSLLITNSPSPPL